MSPLIPVTFVEGSAAALPAGVMLEYGGAAAPDGFLLCDGAEVSRTVYADLFAAIGENYGVGDGSTTFDLPDRRGRVGVGFAASGGHTDVSTLGNDEGSLLANRRSKHPHTVTDPGHGHTQDQNNNVNSPVGTTGSIHKSEAVIGNPATVNSNTTGITVGAAGSAIDTPAYLVVNYIIKT
jgi:microcystin-dependent protein